MNEMDRIMERAKSQCGFMQDAVGDVDAIRATAASADGTVVACVDGMGALVELTITNAVTTMEPKAVAALTIATIHQAVHRSNVERERLMNQLSRSLGEV
ncbi:YbaB/EbfC family nucleoid-associated protein [Rhodococcus globerulus]|uniref:YbaB/EbfC family nucleoid-associated protein n=1 Tax=Rhodococcus globerulus TaxID=33008 RepID=UPI001F1F7DC1|nr:YbaB/EbfC family nucleoid-associated protein [Rhodococcus globerulus]MCE4268018.1 YbaB/EbfC family nucleoid-associated protein [Rhodococcus globerulus]